MSSLGNSLYNARKSSGLTQEAVAERLGVSRQTISKWELDDYVAQAYSIYPAEPAGLDRISCYRNVQDTYLREFRGYHRYGLCISFLMHPQISGAPGRNLILEEILKEVTSHPDVWIATGAEIADWWRATYPTDPQ